MSEMRRRKQVKALSFWGTGMQKITAGGLHYTREGKPSPQALGTYNIDARFVSIPYPTPNEVSNRALTPVLNIGKIGRVKRVRTRSLAKNEYCYLVSCGTAGRIHSSTCSRSNWQSDG